MLSAPVSGKDDENVETAILRHLGNSGGAGGLFQPHANAAAPNTYPRSHPNAAANGNAHPYNAAHGGPDAYRHS